MLKSKFEVREEYEALFGPGNEIMFGKSLWKIPWVEVLVKWLGLARTMYIIGTVYTRYFWQGFCVIYGYIRCMYTVLANPRNEANEEDVCSRLSWEGSWRVHIFRWNAFKVPLAKESCLKKSKGRELYRGAHGGYLPWNETLSKAPWPRNRAWRSQRERVL
jgi:hypothetical protein